MVAQYLNKRLAYAEICDAASVDTRDDVFNTCDSLREGRLRLGGIVAFSGQRETRR